MGASAKIVNDKGGYNSVAGNMLRISRKFVWRLGWLTILMLHIPATFKLLGLAAAGESVKRLLSDIPDAIQLILRF